MKSLEDLSDDEIDDLLLRLFSEGLNVKPATIEYKVEDRSDEDLRRIRSLNHPDKWAKVDLEAYRAAVKELHRRRKMRTI